MQAKVLTDCPGTLRYEGPILQPGGLAARFLSAGPASCGFLPGLLFPAGAFPAGAAPMTKR
jgi:hypothetical protein